MTNGALSKRKGKRGEVEVVALLRPLFPEARTTRAAAGGGGEAAGVRGRDIIGTPGYCVQVMLSARPAIERKFREAARAALPNETPIAFTRRDRDECLVTLRAADFLAVLTELREARRFVPTTEDA